MHSLLLHSTRVAALLVATLWALPLAGQPAAQERTRDGLVEISRGLVTIAAPTAMRLEADRLSQRVSELLPRLEADLRQPLTQPVAIALIFDPVPQALQSLNRAAQPWAAGFMLPLQRIGAIRMNRVTNYPFNSTEMVLVHEISHLLMHDKVGRNVPRWFDEAVATHEGRTRGARDLFLFTSAVVFRRTPSLAALDRGFNGSETAANTSYAVSFEFLSWAIRRHGEDFIPSVMDATQRYLRNGQNPFDSRTPFEAAWQDATGTPLELSEQQWRRSIYRLTRWLPVLLNSNWLWVSMAILAFAAFLVRRRQKLEQYQRWEEEEARDAVPINPWLEEPDDTVN